MPEITVFSDFLLGPVIRSSFGMEHLCVGGLTLNIQTFRQSKSFKLDAN